MSSIIKPTLLLLWLCLSLRWHSVVGHGLMTIPPPRSLINTAEDCPHCKNEGGPYVVSVGGARTWPNGVHGQCGGGIYEKSGRSVATYKQGGTIDISFFITAQHGGRHAFRLCPEDTPTEKCFSEYTLERADGKGKYLWVGNGGGAGDGGSYAKSTWRGFIGENYTIKYRLPDDLACERCTLQWWWTTSNSCQIPHAPAWMATTMSSCYDYYPEEFWNCADIAITGDGSGVSTVEAKARRSRSKQKNGRKNKTDKKKNKKKNDDAKSSGDNKDDEKKPSPSKAKSKNANKKKNSPPPSKKSSSKPSKKSPSPSKPKKNAHSNKKHQTPKPKSGSSSNKKGSRKNI